MAESKATLVMELKDFVSSKLGALGSKLQGLGQKLEQSKFLFGALGAAITAAGGLAVKAAGDFEQWRISFTTMLGSADRANIMLNKIKKFATETPFDLPQVVQGAKSLLAYGIEADKLIPTFKTLGDITAGVGADKLPQLTLAFGQVKTATRLTGQELRQFTEAGVPLIAALADSMGVAESAVKDLVSEGKVGFKDVEKALQSLTSAGGQFDNLMSKQMDSVQGKMSNLGDTIFQIKVAFGDALLPIIKPIIDKLIIFAEAILNLDARAKGVIIIVSALTAGLSLLLAGIGGIMFVLPVLTAAFGVLVSAVGPVIIIVGTLSALVVTLKDDFIILGNWIVEIFESIQEKIAGFFDFFFEKFNQFIEFIKSFLPESVLEGLAQISEMLEGWKNTAVEKFNDVQTGASVAFNAMKQKAGDALSKMTSFVKTNNTAQLKDFQDFNKKKLEDDIVVTKKIEEELEKRAKAQAFALKQEELRQQARRTVIDTISQQITDIFGRESKAAFLVGKASALSNAIMNTAEGATKALALGPIVGPPLAVLIKALGAVQIGVISSQAFKGLAEGGLVMPTAGGTIARIGEAGKAEAVIPLDDPATQEKLAEAFGGGGTTININVEGTLVSGDVAIREFAERIDRELFQLQKTRQSVSI